MTRYLIILLLFLSLSCDKKRDTSTLNLADTLGTKYDDSLQNADPGQIKFADYTNRLPRIDLPFKFSCDSGLVWPKIDYENNVIKKFKPAGAGILGKIYQSDKSVGILYTYPADIIFPVIKVLDNEGHEVTTIDLFEESNCISDMNYSAVTRGLITNDLRILSSIEIITCDDNGKTCDTTRTNLERAIN
jgi:hypothetical protein